jgi:hypothetical protein
MLVRCLIFAVKMGIRAEVVSPAETEETARRDAKHMAVSLIARVEVNGVVAAAMAGVVATAVRVPMAVAEVL